MTFSSKILNSLALHLIRHFFAGFIIFLLLKFLFKVDFSNIHIKYYVIGLIFYAILTYVYIGLVNHDFIVFKDKIEVINRVPFFRNKKVFKYEDIKLIQFRHEWTEEFEEKFKLGIFGFLIRETVIQSFIPPDYKWIKIVSDRNYKFFCFGLEFDYYDNEGPLIEELFYQLADYGIDVRWTNVKLNYYAGMMNKVNEKRKKAST
jgi:hypothetical protein